MRKEFGIPLPFDFTVCLRSQKFILLGKTAVHKYCIKTGKLLLFANDLQKHTSVSQWSLILVITSQASPLFFAYESCH